MNGQKLCWKIRDPSLALMSIKVALENGKSITEQVRTVLGILSEAEQATKNPVRALTKPVKLEENDTVRFGVMFSTFVMR